MNGDSRQNPAYTYSRFLFFLIVISDSFRTLKKRQVGPLQTHILNLKNGLAATDHSLKLSGRECRRDVLGVFL